MEYLSLILSAISAFIGGALLNDGKPRLKKLLGMTLLVVCGMLLSYFLLVGGGTA